MDASLPNLYPGIITVQCFRQIGGKEIFEILDLKIHAVFLKRRFPYLRQGRQRHRQSIVVLGDFHGRHLFQNFFLTQTGIHRHVNMIRPADDSPGRSCANQQRLQEHINFFTHGSLLPYTTMPFFT